MINTLFLKLVEQWYVLVSKVLWFSCLICLVLISLYGEGNGNPLQYFCLENPMDRGAW